jgi:predicted DCC family thiol-disulfide oxidoreductase YuxK
MKTARVRKPQATIVYDGLCLLCRRSCAFLRTLDWLRRLEFVDLRDARIVDRPDLDRARSLESIHVFFADGRRRTGFDAVRSLLWLLLPLIPLAPFLYIPGVGVIGRRAYHRIATGRKVLPS